MRIACPACNTAYDVPENRLAPGQDVRCARCSAVWSPLPLLDEPPFAIAATDPQPTAPGPGLAASGSSDDLGLAPVPPQSLIVSAPAGAAPAPKTGRDRFGHLRGVALAGWLLTFAILGTFGWLAVTRRAEIVHAWPPSERAYALLGLLR